MTTFDYSTAAELFAARSRWPMRQTIEYRRFASAADAIRYAIEELRPALLAGAYLEVDEERFDRYEIRRLYDSADYPLADVRRCDSSKHLEECSDRGRWPRQA